MNGNAFGVLSPGALAGAERSEGERSEPQRTGAAAKAGADSPRASRPDPEVVAKPKRRTYTAEYKQRILLEAETAAAIPGVVGALLRREGLYSSLLSYWRRERADGIREALTPRKRGPKSKRNPLEDEVQKLRRQNGRLAEDLRKAHIIIDVQKKSGCAVGESESGAGPRPRGEILMGAVTELASEVGTSAACQTLRMPRASYYRDRGKTFFRQRPRHGLRRHAHLVRPNRKRSWLACTKNASKIARQPLFMRPCLMKGNISALSGACIDCSAGTGSPANVAIS